MSHPNTPFTDGLTAAARDIAEQRRKLNAAWDGLQLALQAVHPELTLTSGGGIIATEDAWPLTGPLIPEAEPLAPSPLDDEALYPEPVRPSEDAQAAHDASVERLADDLAAEAAQEDAAAAEHDATVQRMVDEAAQEATETAAETPRQTKARAKRDTPANGTTHWSQKEQIAATERRLQRALEYINDQPTVIPSEVAKAIGERPDRIASDLREQLTERGLVVRTGVNRREPDATGGGRASVEYRATGKPFVDRDGNAWEASPANPQ